VSSSKMSAVSEQCHVQPCPVFMQNASWTGCFRAVILYLHPIMLPVKIECNLGPPFFLRQKNVSGSSPEPWRWR
jgi:hypothetical protein